MHDFKKLNVWQVAIEYVTEVYRITETFPKTEIYGLTNQIRKATVSIPSNIAEGAGRKNDGEFLLFLGYAYGSCCELETQIIIANNLKYLDKFIVDQQLSKIYKIEKMIYNLMKSLK